MSSARKPLVAQDTDDETDGKTMISRPIDEDDQSPLDRAFSERTIVGHPEDFQKLDMPPPPFTKVVGGGQKPQQQQQQHQQQQHQQQQQAQQTQPRPRAQPMQQPAPQPIPREAHEISEVTFSDLSSTGAHPRMGLSRLPWGVFLAATLAVLIVITAFILKAFWHSTPETATSLPQPKAQPETPPPQVQAAQPHVIVAKPRVQEAQPQSQEVRPAVTPPPVAQGATVDAITQKFDRAFFNTQGQFQSGGAAH